MIWFGGIFRNYSFDDVYRVTLDLTGAPEADTAQIMI